jgi:hypothetical protein
MTACDRIQGIGYHEATDKTVIVRFKRSLPRESRFPAGSTRSALT